MPEIRTDAIRTFQKRVHELNNTNQRDLRLTAQECKNLSNELSQLTAFLLELQTVKGTSETFEISIQGSKF